MGYFTRVLVALDQLAGTVLLGQYPDETISAACHRRQWKRAERFINWLFRDDQHCARAYVSEMAGVQNNGDYRK